MRNGWHGLGESFLLKDREISLSACSSNTESLCPSLWQRWSEKTESEREDRDGTVDSGRVRPGVGLHSKMSRRLFTFDQCIHYALRLLTLMCHISEGEIRKFCCECARCVYLLKKDCKKWTTHMQTHTCFHLMHEDTWLVNIPSTFLFQHIWLSCQLWLNSLRHTHTHLHFKLGWHCTLSLNLNVCELTLRVLTSKTNVQWQPIAEIQPYSQIGWTWVVQRN